MKKTPRHYQLEAIQFAKDRSSSILALDPGLGKTYVSICLRENNQPMMIICPKSIKGNWKKELNSEGITNVTILNGRQEKFVYPKSGECVILNIDIMAKEIDISDMPSNMLLIVDECHVARNPKLARSAILHRLSKAVRALRGKVVGLSGTPILTSPYDAYGVLFALDLLAETYGSFTNYRREFQAVKSQFGLRWIGPRNAQTLEPLKRVMLRMRRSEVAREIPLKTYEEYDVSIPARLNIGYNEIQIEGEDEIVLSRVKMQLSTWRREVELEKAKASMDYLKQMIESTPLVIFALHTETVDLISSSLGIPSIQGDTSSNERQRIVDDFQQGKTSGVVGTFGAMSVGLTLTHSHHVIMISREWTPAINAQAEDRCCRMGQNRGVIVIDIVSNSKVDQLITSVLKRKQRLIDSIVEAT